MKRLVLAFAVVLLCSIDAHPQDKPPAKTLTAEEKLAIAQPQRDLSNLQVQASQLQAQFADIQKRAAEVNAQIVGAVAAAQKRLGDSCIVNQQTLECDAKPNAPPKDAAKGK